eukprot:CAMPEP_0198575994 /NCGR_PEP_ID=MMETSP1462-20131121/116947_1 /TAXON_ID=1333877 /ORGANISM="Brandtodinium nutriculum, Strain RCC3387" /LENGTH=45 /DNA_ID= /DNA_START= /DNA_END= /DNA_ORIENTATION=
MSGTVAFGHARRLSTVPQTPPKAKCITKMYASSRLGACSGAVGHR